LESFYAARGIDELLFAGEEGMALRTDFKMDFRLRGARLESFAARTSHDRVNVVGMYVCLHRASAKRQLYIEMPAKARDYCQGSF